MIRETPLADLIPLWRTLREEGVTALVTPALDYVGALELGTLDVRFSASEQASNIGEGLRSLIGSLEDETTLHFVYQVDTNIEHVIREYEATCRAEEPALRAYVAGRARWLRAQRVRHTRVYLFFSEASPAGGGLARGQLGLQLLYTRSPAKLSEPQHRARVKRLGQLRDRLTGRLGQLGISSRELDLADVRRVHFELLNPGRARVGAAPPNVTLREQTWSPESVRRHGNHLLELTEAEQLCFEDVEDGRGAFRHGSVVRRVCTLKVLPEAGTNYCSADPLLRLATRDSGTERAPFPYTLAVTVHVKHQGKTRFALDRSHSLVKHIKNALPFLQNESVDQDEAERAKRESIRGLFEELNNLSSKIVALSVSLLLEGKSLEEVDAQAEAARVAFSQCGNSEMLVEEVTQIPAFLSMLPGAGPYQLRKKGCTSRNAADFLPVFAAWNGTAKAASVLLTPGGDFFRLHLADKRLSTAHHGLVVADTGSGKSFAFGNLVLDALAAGDEAILIDNGNSWEPLTALLGGIHIPVDIKTSVSPFVEYAAMLDRETGEFSNEELQDVVTFLQVCATEPGQPGFDKVTFDAVARAVRWSYETHFRDRPAERPLLGHFRDALRHYPWENADDRAIAERVHRKLGPFADGMYADFVNRPSSLRFDAKLLTFDLQRVSQDPVLKQLAMACIIQAVTNRASSRRAHTIVAVDEGHEHLGQDDVGERFLAGCYRKMRKYDVSMWMISQALRDFVNAKAGPAIIANSALKIFLWHNRGHEEVASYFGLSPGALEAFRRLERKPGHYSDFLLMYGKEVTTVRLAPHPLAYWILTTDPQDKELLARAQKKNPMLDRLRLLEELAAIYPHGVVGQGVRSRSAA
ncbi:TraC family protein [Anaeromyxobacter terrae]|uniref:TraC family protein n=1 Tax=Anaeromyxobacter terrae TaxID=2925406 RepID=UPI001F5656CB|nr:TraC family protein [Anaeromyxobacter sp. SG22]